MYREIKLPVIEQNIEINFRFFVLNNNGLYNSFEETLIVLPYDSSLKLQCKIDEKLINKKKILNYKKDKYNMYFGCVKIPSKYNTENKNYDINKWIYFLKPNKPIATLFDSDYPFVTMKLKTDNKS